MNNCPNCLANTPFKKVYRDGLVFVKCEYCNTIFEDKTTTKKTREVSERIRNEIQNDVQNEKSSGKVFVIVIGLMILIFIIDTLSKLN
ncbi:hypothetical protein ACE1MS_12555 [Lysinibacillus sp. fkY74-1]|uniref:Uncharacterized protein n=3 Tax=Lysinibacillus TaxID=400634 RepID=B1HQ03_LYSSC|nr:MULTISPECIES: hypothetical protein [Lysinibacillus]MBE5083611.1 hypothetical protein [Bacillus thuringiensis]ACA40646.1 hypothetical protein Bsph_3133 [Lysinibacillus sphaericus C3-41]AMO33371.1 hypothetical protein AR327_13440 [Lysinibacillus sphaericus]AMR91526.1 hypothetical protein A1T07_15780 [Lysinibacillus sphaericus]ANA45573.1 hypothetical protein A2J09_08440 [Lysinibacillus sphaericus]